MIGSGTRVVPAWGIAALHARLVASPRRWPTIGVSIPVGVEGAKSSSGLAIAFSFGASKP